MDATRLSRIAPFAAVSGLLYLGCHSCVHAPLRAELDRISAETASRAARAVALRGEDALDRPEAVRERARREERRVAGLLARLPSPAEADRLLHSLNRIAVGGGLTVRRFAPEPRHVVDGFTVHAASMDVQGSFFAVSGFFARIAGTPRLVMTDNVILRAPPGEDGTVSARLVAMTLSPVADSPDGAPDREAPTTGGAEA